jgi:Leucine-rich repeat (LRR) protein
MSARYEADGIVSFTKGQRATIILPITPDADKGRYYRLDRVENYQIIFEEEPHPQARVPYIIIPNEDFSIDISALDLTGYRRDSTNIYGVSFIGTYVKDVIGYKDSYYYYTIDATSDCRNDMNRYNVYVGALRAFIQVRIWNNGEKMPIVIHDAGSEPIIINGTYPTFIDEGNEWHYANICEMVDTSIVVEENFAKYYFKGDTIINQKKYKQLWGDFIYRNTESHPKKKPGTSYGSGYVMGVREEEGKVFVNVEEYDKQLMMFSYEEQKWNLTKEDDEYVLYDFNSPSNYVIPEVGSKLDLIFPYPLQRMDYWDGIIRTWNLNLFYCDGQLIYKSQNYYPDLFFLIDGIAINETNFPDENFRNYLLSQEYGADSLLTDDEISGITELSVSGKNITSLQGIEYFTALTLLSCTHNQLFLLDVSKNTALKSLGCSYNQLISLDVSKNTKLTGLYCGRNQLTSLDVSKNAVLTELYCFNNKLTTLDVSKNTALKSLGCSENQLTSLDVSKNTALSLLACQYNDIHDAAMDTLVAGLSASTKGTMHALVADSEGEHNVMTVKQVAAAKVKGWTVLAYNGGEWADYDGSEPTPNEIAINETNFPDINFRNWLLSQEYGKDGILTDEEISDITEINVEKKDIANLQGIEKFTSLTSLYCSINELTTLDLSGCPQLNALDCSFNKQLASINLSGCKALQHLYCHGCKLTAIDLTDCTELIYLDCGTNLLTTIDPSPCKKVMSFVCSGNQLTTIDISACKALRSFDCQENQLTTLDCSGLTELQAILCAMNALTSINVSGCSKLIHLLCEFNNLGLDAFQHIMTNIPERDESDGAFMFVYSESTIEGSYDHTPDHNICSKEQVAIAKAKGWVVYYENNTGDSLPYEGVEVTPEIAYRPFIEDGKVWKVGIWSGNPVQMVEYFYFDGDTIVDGKACKWMWCQQYANEGSWCYNTLYRHEDPYKPLFRIGAFYEEDKKVYFQPWEDQLGGLYANDFWLLYDFSVMPGDTIFDYVMTAKASGGMPEFKGTYYDLTPYTEPKEYEEPLWNNRWLEGVGRADVPYYNLYNGETGHYTFLMSCTVGDEVIYLNDEYEDGATPSMETKKRRFDFTHTVKIQPKTPSRRGEEAALYGEYNEKSLDIRLDPLDEAYSVCITNQKTGETLYEKTINAGSIVGLNIDISKYPEGQYKISIDNSNETFIGEFEINTTGIEETPSDSPSMGRGIFNLQGQRIETLQKGLNIMDGKKVWVK